ncbi:MAG TPA: O-antigen ligase family protein [Sumerlaeia bacterium]|nr:O-antigen ligase family protein [Sumerlaeia bacterium]
MSRLPINRALLNAQPFGDSSLRRAYWMTVLFFAVLLALIFNRPTLAYPLQGLWLMAAFGLTGVLALAVGVRARLSLAGCVSPGAVLFLFTAWALARTASSTVPTDGADVGGSRTLGLLLFWLGAFTVRGADVFLSAPPGGKARGIAGERLVVSFFACLGAAFACHAILQCHFLYPAQLERLRREPAFDPNDPVWEGVAYALGLGRIGSRFGGPNILCGFLAMCLPMAAAVAWEARGRGRRGVRATAGLVAAAMAYAAYRTDSAGGALAFCLGLALIAAAVLARRWRRGDQAARRGALPLLVLACGAWLVLRLTGVEAASEPPPPSPSLDAGTSGSAVAGATAPSEGTEPAGAARAPLFSETRQAKTAFQRLCYWRSGWRMWSDAPLTGHGLGSYGRLYPRNRILGAGETRYAHNFVIQTAVETGLAGLGLFIWFLFLLARRLVQGLRSGSPTASWLAIGGALLLFLIDSLGEYTFQVREIYGAFCFLAGAFCAGANAQARPSDTREEIRRGRVGGASRRAFAGALLAVTGLVVLVAGWQVVLPAQMGDYYVQRMRDAQDEAIAARRRGDFAEAARLSHEAFRQADHAWAWQLRNPRRWQDRAHAHAALGRPQAAVHDLDKACEMHPDSASLRAEAADYEWRLGNRERALALIDEAIALYPLKSPHHERRARFLLEAGRPEEALAAAREAARVAFTPQERESSRSLLRELAADQGAD